MEPQGRDSQPLATKLWVLVNLLQKLLGKAREGELRKYGLSLPQYGILNAVEALGPSPTVAEVSRWTLCSPNSISTIVQRMVAKGMLVKSQDTKRKNLVRLSLTPKGRRSLTEARKGEAIARTFGILSEKQQKQVEKLLAAAVGSALDVQATKRTAALPAAVVNMLQVHDKKLSQRNHDASESLHAEKDKGARRSRRKDS